MYESYLGISLLFAKYGILQQRQQEQHSPHISIIWYDFMFVVLLLNLLMKLYLRVIKQTTISKPIKKQ